MYIENSLEVCCGIIQGSDKRRFCIKPLGSCSTKGHKTKLSVPSKHLYIKQACRGQAHLEPNLPISLRPTDLGLDELLEQENPFEVWVAYFESLKASSGSGVLVSKVGSPESWEDTEPPTLASLSRAYNTFKTPKKMKLGAMMSPSHVPLTPQAG